MLQHQGGHTIPRPAANAKTSQRVRAWSRGIRRRACTCSRAASNDSAVIEAAKQDLLYAVQGTNRGSRADRTLRGQIEELQVAVESLQATNDLDYSLLGGLWRLEYTTAQDVLPILEADNFLRNPWLPNPIQIGNIYQRFTSPYEGEGKVDNVIQFGIPFLSEGKEGVTITVEASYEVRSGHRICLAFDAARVGRLRISESLEALLAPALLPRTPLQHALLLAIKEFQLRFPFRSAAQVAATTLSSASSAVSSAWPFSNAATSSLLGGSSFPSAPSSSRVPSAGGSYQLTYLDHDMLIGRAAALGGSFVFTRAADVEDPK